MSSQKFGILCFAPGFGGLEINTLRLAGWMQGRGWEVPLLLRDGSAIYRHAVQRQLQATGITSDSVRNDLKILDRWVRSNRINVLLVPFNKDIKLVSWYKRFYNRKVKLIYQQHMQVGVSKRDLIHTLRYSMLDAWICPLQYLKEETLRKTRIPARKIAVIPFGVDTAPFKESEWTKDAARKAFDLPVTAKIIGVLGRIDPKKGQDLVIRGIDHLSSKYGKDYHLLLLGDATLNEGDDYSMALKKIVEDAHLEGRVHFRGYQPDVMQFFRAIDVFAMPSHGETFGMVTLEAMAAGVPVVGTGRDGTKELLKDGELGYLFPLNDVAAFCGQVIAIERNEKLPELLAAAKNEVTQRYNVSEMCECLGALVRALL